MIIPPAKLEKQLNAWVEAQLEAARLFYKNSEKKGKIDKKAEITLIKKSLLEVQD